MKPLLGLLFLAAYIFLGVVTYNLHERAHPEMPEWPSVNF